MVNGSQAERWELVVLGAALANGEFSKRALEALGDFETRGLALIWESLKEGKSEPARTWLGIGHEGKVVEVLLEKLVAQSRQRKVARLLRKAEMANAAGCEESLNEALALLKELSSERSQL